MSMSMSVFHIKNSSLDQALHMQEILCLIGEYLTWVGRIDLGLVCKEFYNALTVIKHLRLNRNYSFHYTVNEEFQLRVSACVKDPVTQIEGYNYVLLQMHELQPLSPYAIRRVKHPYNRFAIDDRIVDLSLLPDEYHFSINDDNGGQPILLSSDSDSEDQDSDSSDEDSDNEDSEDNNSDSQEEEDEDEDEEDELSPSQLAEIDEEIIAICINIDVPL